MRQWLNNGDYMASFCHILDLVGNYESRKVGRDELRNGLTVSTAYTTDEGYETALIDQNGVHPVARYESKEDAVIGHGKWVAKASSFKSGDAVTKAIPQ